MSRFAHLLAIPTVMNSSSAPHSQHPTSSFQHRGAQITTTPAGCIDLMQARYRRRIGYAAMAACPCWAEDGINQHLHSAAHSCHIVEEIRAHGAVQSIAHI